MSDTKIKFMEAEYGLEDLQAMDDAKLLELRNLIATAIGVASIRGFKDHAQAVEGTMKALSKFAEVASADSTAPTVNSKAPKEPKAPKVPKERGLAKSAMAGYVKRPTLKMFSVIKKIAEHDGTQGRAHRWANYKDGMTLIDVIETEGTEVWDVQNWVNQKIMTTTEPTQEVFLEQKAAWYARHNLIDPDTQKETKTAEVAAKKEARESAAATKKAAADAAKAAADAAKAEAAPAPAPEAVTA